MEICACKYKVDDLVENYLIMKSLVQQIRNVTNRS